MSDASAMHRSPRSIDQSKTDFIAGVTHELRIPLTSVLGYAELLEGGAGGQLSAEQSQLVAADAGTGITC